MPLELTCPGRVSLLTWISQCGYLVRGLISWVSLKIGLLKLSIGGLSRSLIPLTVLLPLILLFLLEDWPLLQGR